MWVSPILFGKLSSDPFPFLTLPSPDYRFASIGLKHVSAVRIAAAPAAPWE
jgi:hypothetical protein